MSAADHAKARDNEELFQRMVLAVRAGRVRIAANPAVLDFAGSPVHSPWDHLAPLLVMMLGALAILLATGLPLGLVSMTLGVLIHIVGSRYLVAWRLQQRTVAVMLHSLAYWQAVWRLGGVALTVTGSHEPPCLAPFGDWRKFTRRNLGADQPQPAVASPPVESPPPPPPPPPSVVVEPPPFEPVFPTPRPVVVGEVDEDLADTPWDGDTVAGDESVEIIDNEAAPQPSPAP